jgi:hypothetical protein
MNIRFCIPLPFILGILVLSESPAPGAGVHLSIEEEDLLKMIEPEAPRPYRPPFSEFAFLTLPAPNAPEVHPPDFGNANEFVFPAQGKPTLAANEPKARLYDLDTPPLNRHWAKIAAYPILGFPRDAIDLLFGVAGHVPLVNLPVTGVYEIGGIQYLMRHPKDFHRYGGQANRNGHGWIGGTGWGWFSNLNRTEFSEIDEQELARRKEHNAAAMDKAAKSSEAARLANEGQNRLARLYLNEALEDCEYGRYSEALPRLWTYCQNRPKDFAAQAYYLICLAQEDEASGIDAQWRLREMNGILPEWPASNLIDAVAILRSHLQRLPGDIGVRYWLCWTYGRLGANGDMMDEARILAADPLGGMRENILVFEAAMMRLQQLEPEEDKAEILAALDLLGKAAANMSRIGPLSADARLAEGRLAVMRGDYASGLAELKALAAGQAGQGRYSYYYAAGLMFEGLFGYNYDRQATLTALKQAAAGLKVQQRKAIVNEAYSEAQKIKPRPRPPVPEMAE